MSQGCPLTSTCVHLLHTHADRSILFSFGMHGSPLYSSRFMNSFFSPQIPTPPSYLYPVYPVQVCDSNAENGSYAALETQFPEL